MDLGRSIWVDGALVPTADATTPLSVHALHYGTGVFEGIRAYVQPDGAAGIVRLTSHLERLVRSAALYRMEIPYTVDELTAATWDLLHDNDLSAAYIRPIAFRGAGRLGLLPTGLPVQVAIMAWPWGAYLGDDSGEQGIRARISSWQRIDANSLIPQAKATGQYLNSALAKMEALESGFEEAILLNRHGLVAEASSENVFVVHGERVVTPRVTDGILPGITRDIVIDICRTLGIDILEGPVDRQALFTCDELFLTGTAAEVVPVRSVEDRTIGDPGPITRRVQVAFRDAVDGRDPQWARHVERSS